MSDEKPAESSEASAPSAPSADTRPEEKSAAEDAAPKKRRKKRKPLEEPSVRRNPTAPDGSERPAFLLGFPEDAELERLMRAFELGDYARVRSDAPALAERTTDPKVRAAAEELARRILPDPLIKVLLGLSVALLVVITFWAYKTHGG